MRDYRSTEYQAMKRLLFDMRKSSSEVSSYSINAMIQGTCNRAYNGLEAREKQHVKKAKYALVDNVKHLGERGALELLAAIGDHMNGCEKI